MAVASSKGSQGLAKMVSGLGRPLPPKSATHLNVNVYHEVEGKAEGGTLEEIYEIPPSTLPTIVTVKSHLLNRSASGLQSPAYMATVRRRKVGTIRKAVADLAQHAQDKDFTVWTFPVIENIKELLVTLADAEEEGNTREVLREIRHSFLDGGWEKYRDPKVRGAVLTILDHLVTAEEVLPVWVDKTFTALASKGLSPAGPWLLSSEDEEADVEEEVPD